MTTIKDVAKYANVSIGTVSKYINGLPIRENNAERIREAIAALHYRVNATARTMKTARSMLIAIIMDDVAGTYYPHIVKRIEQLLYPHGYNVLIMDSDGSSTLEREKMEVLLEKNVDGFIVFPLSGASDNYQYILSQERPLCIVDQYMPGLACCQIVSDNVGAVYQATSSLLNAGHRRIGVITGKDGNTTATERLRGYLLAHESFGLAPADGLIQATGFEEWDGVNGLAALMSLPAPPTACIACNLHTTQGAVRYAIEHHIPIPQKLTLIGFDHMQLPILSGLDIPIISQDIDAIAQTTVDCLLRSLTDSGAVSSSVFRIGTVQNDFKKIWRI